MRTLKKFIHTFRGSSFPTEIETATGDRWILKMRGCGNGPRGLISEFIVNRMAHLAGWEVPDVDSLLIPHDFPWNFGTDEFDDIVQKSFGFNLGIRFIPEAQPVSEIELKKLPIRFLQRMMAIDIFFANYDRLAVSQNVLKTKEGSPWMIDHASCLFLDPVIGEKPFTLATNHVLKNERALILNAKVLFEIANPDHAEKALSEIPSEWFDEARISSSQVSQSLLNRIQRLKKESI